MALTRSSQWIRHNASAVRVKDMSVPDLHTAIQDIHHMELSNDIYVVACLCELLNMPQPHRLLSNRDEWLDLLMDEVQKRNRRLNMQCKMQSLVKMLKLW
jgi:hypothetical protein